MGAPAKPTRSKPIHAIVDHVNWFEIPVYHLERAKAFYDHLYGMQMDTTSAGEYAMAFFPASNGVGGALVQGPGCVPSDTGPLLYLNAGQDLDGMLARVVPAGGRIVMGRTMISEMAGAFALFIDSEGNRLALHEAPVPTTISSAPAKPREARKSPPRLAAKKSAGRKKR